MRRVLEHAKELANEIRGVGSAARGGTSSIGARHGDSICAVVRRQRRAQTGCSAKVGGDGDRRRLPLKKASQVVEMSRRRVESFVARRAKPSMRA
jgi:hypothetical protein